MKRCWLLTWTTYGTWLPGDNRGCVSNLRNADGTKVINNQYGEEVAGGIEALRHQMLISLVESPKWLSRIEAEVVVTQICETTAFRGWVLLAVAVMSNHVPVLIEVPEEQPAELVMRDLKSYSTRALKRHGTDRSRTRWWTTGGSQRLKPDTETLQVAFEYVRQQRGILAQWFADGLILEN